MHIYIFISNCFSYIRTVKNRYKPKPKFMFFKNLNPNRNRNFCHCKNRDPKDHKGSNFQALQVGPRAPRGPFFAVNESTYDGRKSYFCLLKILFWQKFGTGSVRELDVYRSASGVKVGYARTGDDIPPIFFSITICFPVYSIWRNIFPLKFRLVETQSLYFLEAISITG